MSTTRSSTVRAWRLRLRSLAAPAALALTAAGVAGTIIASSPAAANAQQARSDVKSMGEVSSWE